MYQSGWVSPTSVCCSTARRTQVQDLRGTGVFGVWLRVWGPRHLGGDAGVVGAGEPERGAAAHARVAHHHVLQRHEHGVAHVQPPRHVRRRHRCAKASPHTLRKNSEMTLTISAASNDRATMAISEGEEEGGDAQMTKGSPVALSCGWKHPSRSHLSSRARSAVGTLFQQRPGIYI